MPSTGGLLVFCTT